MKKNLSAEKLKEILFGKWIAERLGRHQDSNFFMKIPCKLPEIVNWIEDGIERSEEKLYVANQFKLNQPFPC